jgi:ABC-type uncharacterized transport system YnjBCD ATPase subunit
VPVLAIENVSFNYPGGKELYSKVDFGVDLQTRVALVGPNGGGNLFEMHFRPCLSYSHASLHPQQLAKPP